MCYWHRVRGGQGGCSTPYSAQDDSTTENDAAPWANGTMTEKPPYNLVFNNVKLLMIPCVSRMPRGPSLRPSFPWASAFVSGNRNQGPGAAGGQNESIGYKSVQHRMCSAKGRAAQGSACANPSSRLDSCLCVLQSLAWAQPPLLRKPALL